MNRKAKRNMLRNRAAAVGHQIEYNEWHGLTPPPASANLAENRAYALCQAAYAAEQAGTPHRWGNEFHEALKACEDALAEPWAMERTDADRRWTAAADEKDRKKGR